MEAFEDTRYKQIRTHRCRGLINIVLRPKVTNGHESELYIWFFANVQCWSSSCCPNICKIAYVDYSYVNESTEVFVQNNE